MSVRPDPNYIPKQEMPPSSGFAHGKSIMEFTKGARGPKGWQLWLGTSAIMFWGFSRLGAGNKKRAEQKLFERQEKYTLVSLLQNEADREFLMREKKLQAQEAQIMSEVPGWEVGKSQYYNKHRWTPPHILDSSRSNIKK
jgi:NADH dehydrogenase (ubiquinone) 1 alpha subcomplex subunit 13